MKRHSKLLALIGIGLFGALAITGAKPAVSGTKPVSPGHSDEHQSKKDAPEIALRLEMRKLWEDHVSYTRNYVISALAELPDTPAAANRLLRNQDDIGNAIAPYYGDAAAKKLSGLLRDHILIATEVVKAAKADDKDALATQQKKWQTNGKDIAAFLAGANPHWKQTELEAMMQTHLDLLTNQVTARLSKNWSADIQAYDQGHEHILKMADALSDGIAKQFPDKFAQAAN